MTPTTQRLAGVLGAGAVATPFAVAAVSQGTAGLAAGAAAVVLTTLIGTLGPELFWLLALVLPARERRWNSRHAASVDELHRRNNAAATLHAKTVAARAAAVEPRRWPQSGGDQPPYAIGCIAACGTPPCQDRAAATPAHNADGHSCNQLPNIPRRRETSQ